MLLRNTLRRSLLGLLLAPLLTACATDRPAIVLPPAERLEPVAFPAIPAGEAVCDGTPCLSDRQVANLLADLGHALDIANTKLLWLKDWASRLAD